MSGVSTKASSHTRTMGYLPWTGLSALEVGWGGNQAASTGSLQGSCLKDKTRDKDPLLEHLSPLLSSVAHPTME